MPALSNAERQRRFRERRDLQLRNDPSEIACLREENERIRASLRKERSWRVVAGNLTEEQEAERHLLIGDLLSTRPWGRRPRRAPPLFMGLDRDAWLLMRPELQAHFGFAEIVEQAHEMMQADLHASYHRSGRRIRKSTLDRRSQRDHRYLLRDWGNIEE